MYVKPGPQFTRLINAKDCDQMATDQKYIKKVSDVRYRLEANNMMRLKDEENNQTDMVSDSKALSRL